MMEGQIESKENTGLREVLNVAPRSLIGRLDQRSDHKFALHKFI